MVATALGRGLKEDTVASWVDREQTFPRSQGGGMNWLSNSVTNSMVVWELPWAACDLHCPLGPGGHGRGCSRG